MSFWVRLGLSDTLEADLGNDYGNDGQSARLRVHIFHIFGPSGDCCSQRILDVRF